MLNNLTKATSESPLTSVGNASFSYLLIDAMLALTALVVGFFTALIYFRHTQANSAEAADAEAEAADAANAANRASMAAQQLADLARGMSSDVTSHNKTMEAISGELHAFADEHAASEILVSVQKILEANSVLQDQLTEAERKIQAQAEEIRSQQSEARTDSLTGLHNRRAFDAAMNDCIRKYEGSGTPFALMMLDVDHFKKFNDTHGHQAGDEVLRKVAETLRAVLKQNDLPCRYGGEEFAVVMPNTTAQNGRIAAGRVRKAIELMNVGFEGKELSVTASVGVAEVIDSDDEVQLIRRADDAVYASKEAGRNCGHWHDGESCLPLKVSSPTEAETDVEASKTKAPAGTTAGSAHVAGRLPDKKVFASELRRRISESHRFGVPLSVLYLRVKDHESLVNTYGDAVGDLVLDSVVTFIQSALRDMDLLAMHDVSEFVVMLPGSSEAEARQVGRRLRTAITQCELPLGDSQLKLAIDHGVTDVRPDDDVQTMINRAIEAALADVESATVGSR